ncbi:low molecular weight protein-tyrosine-phosphatase [Shewanella intestini]|uniref:protein-tyrosine-phosphatase n=1 Tax=Shewanella intestini TaxID=2017544 RepID=A0ABS5I146_9GAMM|nr:MULTISPECIES: low molecular weight protein-tyrosine-phosphatase [Shewanella]MBR9727753.1 low molecular weight phosphotyrosine protein phosphatase [Shewanella intestini]MRG36254.1 low molecular weight phosphotyrosine protein phosphatase [Shewanella sp. XMDDZSB0408]
MTAVINSVLFVCMGNICRSPTAEAVFRQQAQQLKLNLRIDSAGTIAYHQGNRPDPRAIAAGQKRGLNFDNMLARQIVAEDFERFDLILAADNANMADLIKLCPSHQQHKLQMMLSFADTGESEVPDPYYGQGDGFEYVLDLLETSLSELAKLECMVKRK